MARRTKGRAVVSPSCHGAGVLWIEREATNAYGAPAGDVLVDMVRCDWCAEPEPPDDWTGGNDGASDEAGPDDFVDYGPDDFNALFAFEQVG